MGWEVHKWSDWQGDPYTWENPDGSTDSVPKSGVLSRALICDKCGLPIDKKSEILKRAGGKIYCNRAGCQDEPGPKKRR